MEEKKTYALIFSIDCYEREELAKMSQTELYELASVASTVGYDEASVLTLDELSYKINEDIISFDNCWLYFVNI
jgi:hypothetical protein